MNYCCVYLLLGVFPQYHLAVAVKELWSVFEGLVEWLTYQQKPDNVVDKYMYKCNTGIYMHTILLWSLGALGRPRLHPFGRHVLFSIEVSSCTVV